MNLMPKQSKYRDMIAQLDITISTYEKALSDLISDFQNCKGTAWEKELIIKINETQKALSYFHFIKYGEFPDK